MAKRLQSREGTCSVEGCDRPIVALRLCQAHYKAARRHNGDPLGHHVTPTCSVEGCDQPARCKGLCNRHYKIAVKHGDPTYQRPVYETCTVEGCDAPANTKGLCNAHYQRLRRYGAPDGKPAKKKPETKPGMLSEEQVRIIQQRRGTTPPGELATECGTTVRTIIAIQAGRNWGWRLK